MRAAPRQGPLLARGVAQDQRRNGAGSSAYRENAGTGLAPFPDVADVEGGGAQARVGGVDVADTVGEAVERVGGSEPAVLDDFQRDAADSEKQHPDVAERSEERRVGKSERSGECTKTGNSG